MVFSLYASTAIAERITLNQGEVYKGHLLHGVDLTAESEALPVLIKIDTVNDPFLGMAMLVSGKAQIKITGFADMKAEGYVISENEEHSNLKVDCHKSRKSETGKECIYGRLSKGQRLSAVFIKTVDYIKRNNK